MLFFMPQTTTTTPGLANNKLQLQILWQKSHFHALSGAMGNSAF